MKHGKRVKICNNKKKYAIKSRPGTVVFTEGDVTELNNYFKIESNDRNSM